MELTKERINEFAYGLLLAVLSKEDIRFDPEQLKRKLSNLPQQLKNLPKHFASFSQEEIQEATKIICHDLVDYAFSFSFSKRKKRKNNRSKEHDER